MPVTSRLRRRPMRPAHMESRLIVLPSGRARPADRAREQALPDIAVAEIPVDEEERPLPPPEPRAKNALLDGPIMRTLLWLAWPNVIALSAGTCVVIAETSYIGRLGVESLAGRARWAAAWRRRSHARSAPAMSIAPRRWPRMQC